MKGLTAIITGAGGGIGRAVAIALAKKGVNLALLGGRNGDKLNETLNEVLSYKVKATAILGDITSEDFLSDSVNKIANEFGGVDILINNAGVAQNASVMQTTIQEFDKIMNINVRAPFILTQLTLPHLKNSNRASIINIGSVVSHAGYPNQSAYSASKHALLGFTKSLASEVYKEGIRVHAVCPGGVYTDMVKISRPDLTGEGMIQPSDIADIIIFLLENRTNAVIDEILVHRVNKEPFLV